MVKYVIQDKDTKLYWNDMANSWEADVDDATIFVAADDAIGECVVISEIDGHSNRQLEIQPVD